MQSLFSRMYVFVFTCIVLTIVPFASADAINTTDFVTTWKTDNTGTTNSTSIGIPLAPSTVYNFQIDWNNDGVIDQTYTATTPASPATYVTHDYGVGNAGTKIIRIRGTFPRIYFNNTADKLKLLQINQWGTNAWTSMNAAFSGCANLDGTISDVPNLSNVTDMAHMFDGTNSFNQPIGNWDVSHVTNMSAMFWHATSFNQPLNIWNTSAVTNMSAMFWHATSFNQPLNSWNVSNVTNMQGMFQSASAFNQPLNSWNTSAVTNMQGMFQSASAFNQPLNSWNTSSVTTMQGMFQYATAFNQPLNSWNTSSVTTMFTMFSYATSFNQDLSGWERTSPTVSTLSHVINMYAVFNHASAFNQPIGNWDVSSVTNMTNMFNHASAFNQPIGNWDVSHVTGMSAMFTGATLSVENYDNLLTGWASRAVKPNIPFDGGNSKYCNATTARSTLVAAPNNWTFTDGGDGCAPTYFVTTWNTANLSMGSSNDTSLTIPVAPGSIYSYQVDWNNDGDFLDTDEIVPYTTSATHDYGAGNGGTKTIRIKGTFPRIYFNNDGDKLKLLQINQWGTNTWTSMNAAFYGCTNLNGTISDTPNLSGVTDMSYMFANATSFNQPIGTWNTSSVTNMTWMFLGATSFNNGGLDTIKNWNTSSVTNMAYMFGYAPSFNQPLNSWNTSSVTNMSYMFSNTSSFNQPLNSWNTSSVINMVDMFSYATSFNQPIGNWNVSNVTDMVDMFRGATSFNQPLNSWNTSAVTNMADMFFMATSFNQPLNSWNTSAVTNMQEMFSIATSFNQPIGTWNVSNVTNMQEMFSIATSFNQDLSGWERTSPTVSTLSHVTRMQEMFWNDTSFNQPIGNWDVSNVIYMQDMFGSAHSFNQPIGNWDVSNVTNMASMFAGATSFNQPIGNWDVSNVTNMQNIFTGATLSVGNYDTLLTGWASRAVKPNISFDGGNSKYCYAASARSTLVAAPNNWTFTDGGVDCSGVYFWNISGAGNWNDTSNWYTNVEHTEMTSGKLHPDTTDTTIILSDVTSNTGPAATVKALQVGNESPDHSATLSIPVTSAGETPMSFVGTSTNAAGNTLTGNATFACTAQNFGIVTGTSTFTQCNATTAPTTVSDTTDTTPTFTGLCAPNTLVTLYNDATALTPSELCSVGGTYSITTTLAPGDYSITVKQSNRKGATFGTSNASSPVLSHTIGCTEGQAWNGISCSSTCTTTEAPSELKVGIDKPYIDCTAHLGESFKYRISNAGTPTFTTVTSTDPISVGTRILYPNTLPVSSDPYKVECLYSGDNYTTADSCTKTMTVRASTADEVQGCARITNNFENFVGYEKWVHNSAFNASVSCFARKADPEITDNSIAPFLIQYGADFSPLGYLNNLIDIGRFTSQISVHTFDNTSTITTCAVRVGDGYSTNSLCQNLGCGGSDCEASSKYLIQPSAANLYCTKEDHAEYTIGCAPGDSYASCIQTEIVGNLYNGLVYNAVTSKYEKNVTFRINDVVTPNNILMRCTSATPQTVSNTTPTCTVSLLTGTELAFRTSTTPVDQFQTLYDPVPRDIDPPMASISGTADGISFNSGTSLTAADGKWINKPVTATIRCTNSPVENNDSCMCAWLVKADVVGTQSNTDWGLTSPLKDIVDYQRIIRNETLQNQEFFIFDNVGNMDPDKSKVSITLGVDTLLPSVSLKTATTTQDGKERVVLQATDNAGGSGLWGSGIKTALINKDAAMSDIKSTFDAECNVASPVYAPFPDTGAGFGPIDSSAIEYDTASQKIVYCVQDNARNELIGIYPFDPNILIGCFSDGSQQFVPNLDDANPSDKYYMPSLIARMGSGKYGYELTDADKTSSMADFRTKLAQNIETLVKEQYCPTMGNFPNKLVNLEEKNTQENPLVYAAKAKIDTTACSETDVENTGPRNTKGYYYFKGSDGNRVLTIAGVSRLTGTKVLIVEGADIYLQGDINYFSRDSSLVIIALKNGNYGGNVYVNPQVTNIDATIIADGALMNGVTDNGNIIPKVWFNDTNAELSNPLTINGRLLTYNTRGGSLIADNDVLQKTTLGICVSNTSAAPSSGTCSGTNEEKLAQAALQDLERFRVVTRIPDDLAHRCTLHVTGVMAFNRPDILTSLKF